MKLSVYMVKPNGKRILVQGGMSPRLATYCRDRLNHDCIDWRIYFETRVV